MTDSTPTAQKGRRILQRILERGAESASWTLYVRFPKSFVNTSPADHQPVRDEVA